MSDASDLESIYSASVVGADFGEIGMKTKITINMSLRCKIVYFIKMMRMMCLIWWIPSVIKLRMPRIKGK
jgi:hypothetical protein